MPSLTVLTLINWLDAIAPQPPSLLTWPSILPGPYIHEMPARVIHVTLQPGTGYVMDGDADSPTFQIRCRGDDNDQFSAELLALDVDKHIYEAQFPATLNFENDLVSVDTVLVKASRVNGAPAPLGPPDDALRYEYVCTYRAIVGV